MMRRLTKERKIRNIILLGFSMVGKTSVCIRFCDRKFDEEYVPTYDNTYQTVVEHMRKSIELKVRDTQGHDEQDVFRNEFCIGAHGFILMYAITSRRSFQMIRDMNRKLVNLMGTNKIPRIIVGNKSDLESDRRVLTSEGQDLADEIGCGFLECSAKNNLNIDAVFIKVLDEIAKSYEEENTQPKPLMCCPEFGTTESEPLPCVGLTAIILTLILGVVEITTGTVLGVETRPNNAEILAYILFAFGIITTIIAFLGAVGAKGKTIFLLVFSVFTSLLLVSEIIAFPLLMKGIPFLVANKNSFTTGFVFACVIQSFAIVITLIIWKRSNDDLERVNYFQLNA